MTTRLNIIEILSIGILSFALFCAITAPAQAKSNRETPLVKAIRTAKSTIVNIHTEKTNRSSDSLFGAGKEKKVTGMGAGIIIDQRGLIVTNYHVVANVSKLEISLSNGRRYTAKLLTFDRKKDLAIIHAKVDHKLDVMPMGTSSDLMLGETVIAVGNPFGYVNSITSGIISSLSRNVEVNETQSYRNVIQTDASINPGNSGGPLLNLDGEVIGINVAIRAGAQRIGFAIPIDDARAIIAKLINSETLNGTYHGLLSNDSKHGKLRKLVVRSVRSGSPSLAAGMKPGDVILKAGEQKVIDRADFERALFGKTAGDAIPVIIKRGDNTKSLTLKLVQHSGNYRSSDVTKTFRANYSPKSNTNASQKTENSSPLQGEVWQELGIRISKMPTDSAIFKNTRYEGGMKITALKSGGVASRSGIRVGDILVGLHAWETVNRKNVEFVLAHPKRNSFNPLKVYILRNGETRYVHVRLPAQSRARIATRPRQNASR